MQPDSGPHGNTAVVSRKRGTPVTKEQIMHLYDRLPRRVRAALASANQPWAPHWADEVVWRRFHSAAIVERIERADREEALRRELQLMAGKG
jgi:hypothetical protein